MTTFDHNHYATGETLLQQGPMTAAHFMRRAVEEIDTTFGAGYAARNPALVVAFMHTCAADHAASLTAGAVGMFGLRIEDTFGGKSAVALANMAAASRRAS